MENNEYKEKLIALMEGLEIQKIEQFIELGKIGDYKNLGTAYSSSVKEKISTLQASTEHSKLNLADVSESANICTRIEVITNKGREYVNWKPTNKIVSVMQDNGKTMKVIVK